MALFENDQAARQFWERSATLSAVRGLGPSLGVDEREAAVVQLQSILSDYYVHLPLKRSSLGIDPVQDAALLLDEARSIVDDEDFFRRYLGIVKRLRDRHTTVALPQPWSTMVAYLPFAVETYSDERGRHLMITKLMCDLGDPRFGAGVEITHWNGVPVRRYVEALSAEAEGANPFARIAIALRSLTARPMRYFLPPDEDWVVLSYNTSKGPGSIGLPWKVYFPDWAPQASEPTSSVSRAAVLCGVDQPTLAVNSVWRDLLSGAQHAEPADQFGTTQNMRFGPVRTPEGERGYLRIFTFEAPDSLMFLHRVAAVLQSLPQDGLILDLRANPGGTIPSGEALAQLFTTEDITPQPTSFRNTRATRALGQLPQFSRWRRSLDMQMDTGDVYSQGFSLTSDGLAPRGVYQGPVALIMDSLCYSTTDFLTAGMQDQHLARIIGVDPVTGAGGANVWTQETLSSLVAATGSPGLDPLPRDMDLTVAMRRSARVGTNTGLPVEGVGVLADMQYSLTSRDVLHGNRDLIAFASRVLRSMRA